MSIQFDTSDPAERARGIAAAASACRRGELVVVPTESAYGVATDAFSAPGIDRLVAAKGRGRDLPIPVLVPSPTTVDGLAYRLPFEARELIEGFWPGGLTVLVRYHPSLAWNIGGAQHTVALRMPLHPVALELLRETGPLALTSANRSGQPSPTTCRDALEQLGSDVALYLDAGPSPESTSSTVVDATSDVLRVLRVGSLDLETLRTVCPNLEG